MTGDRNPYHTPDLYAAPGEAWANEHPSASAAEAFAAGVAIACRGLESPGMFTHFFSIVAANLTPEMMRIIAEDMPREVRHG